ncbi:MAG TPA: RsmB/NOP family class I SAM-dependent RNA methyltransferase [Alphaproteobacteria bacterium]|nr:MAG: RsmB/NOP family class I SAM-dependent RNA methyltransferase [Rhodospirillales bacterium]HOO82348.1 RsmB/NOP family class I SAM-dependent RNA methyltransferase [Alphaproteobacteria bacterium]
MKPASRIQATIDVLEKIAANTRVPMDSVIGDYMRVRRYIGSKDRSEIAERIYNIARCHARLGWWLEKFSAEDTPRNRVLLWLMTAEGVDEKRLKDLFDASKYAPDELSPQETNYVKLIKEGKYIGGGIDHYDMPVEIKVECPPLYEDKLKAYFGDSFESEMSAMLQPATLDLRVNTYLAPREKVINYLEADGVKTKETALSPWGLRCESKAYLAKTKAFGKGWIEIQDEGSQAIATMCDVKPGMQVLDYCAGAGGKTLALGAAMQRKGRIVAMDNDERRLKKGRDRYKKAQIADIIEIRCIEDEKNRKWLKRQKGKFDVVLTDVPCTGTGTWRRNPDMRWRVFGPSLEELTEIQAEILGKVAPLVKQGGRLVYATCSLLPDENEVQIEKFLKSHEDFEIVPVPENLGSPFMRLTPHRHGTDGFFTAILHRRV